MITCFYEMLALSALVRNLLRFDCLTDYLANACNIKMQTIHLLPAANCGLVCSPWELVRMSTMLLSSVAVYRCHWYISVTGSCQVATSSVTTELSDYTILCNLLTLAPWFLTNRPLQALRSFHTTMNLTCSVMQHSR
jgi:hypothetical protein